jgi:hypothetical protein
MTLEAIKKELDGLNVEARDEIVEYLLAKRARRDDEHLAHLAAKLDDKDPSHWMTLEEMEARFRAKYGAQMG